jgi:hypothetical protein
MQRNPYILLLRLGEGAAPSILFLSFRLRLIETVEAFPVFHPSSTKEAADVAKPTAKRQ